MKPENQMRRGVFAAAVLSCFLACSARPANPPAPSQTIPLKYKEAPAPGLQWSLRHDPRTEPFAKEPETSSTVCRGMLRLDSDPLPFLWDMKEAKLYLDLNRNQDLTDDPAGLLLSPDARPSGAGSYYYQKFPKISLALKTTNGVRKVAVQFNLHRYGREPSISAGLFSYWQSKLVIQGCEYQFGLCENLDRSGPQPMQYLFRSWEKRDEPLQNDGGSLTGFSIYRRVYLQGQAYSASHAYVGEGESGHWKIDLKEEQPKLGEIKLTGKFIQRLVLEHGPYTVVFEKPDAVLRVPVGEYSSRHIYLQNGSLSAQVDQPYKAEPTPALHVTEAKPVTLNLGGPLTNTVAVERRGDSLSLSYRLVGADGQNYNLVPQDRSKPPEFAITQDGKTVASGKFAYG